MTEKKVTKPIKYNTIVLDTSTEIETILRQATFEDIKAASTKDREKMAPNEYVLRNLRMSALFDSAKAAGINLVSIQYMKTRWQKDAKGNLFDTGEVMIDGWQRTETQADINIEMNNMIAKVVTNRFDPRMNDKEFKDPNYDDITTALLAEFYGDDEEYPNLVYSVTGRAKSGKNHFAYTFEPPIKVYCFNGGAEFVKRKFPDVHIDIVNFSLPIIDELDPKPWAEPIWRKFYSDFKKTLGV
jgi:hypothetical protein